MLAEVHAIASPFVKVGLHVDTTADALALTDGPVLVEGLSHCQLQNHKVGDDDYPGSINRGLVVTGCHSNGVGSAVGAKLTLPLSIAAWIVCSKRFYYVVFYEGIASPAVDSKISISLRGEVAAIVDGT